VPVRTRICVRNRFCHFRPSFRYKGSLESKYTLRKRHPGFHAYPFLRRSFGRSAHGYVAPGFRSAGRIRTFIAETWATGRGLPRSRALDRSPPYLFLRVKSLISQGLGVGACKSSVPVSAYVFAETGTPKFRPLRRNGFALGHGRNAIARRNGYGPPLHGSAETGTPSLCHPAFADIRKCVPVSAKARAEMGTPIAAQAASFQVFAETGTAAREASTSRGPGGALPRGVHAHGVSGMMRIPRAGLALGWRVFHHSIRMNRISTVPPAGAGILLRVASPHGGRASGERSAGQRQPAMTLHNKRRQPE
jgi:hypothetical protein